MNFRTLFLAFEAFVVFGDFALVAFGDFELVAFEDFKEDCLHCRVRSLPASAPRGSKESKKGRDQRIENKIKSGRWPAMEYERAVFKTHTT